MQSRVVLLLLAVLGVFSDPYSDLRFLSSDVGSTYSGSGDQSGDYTITPQPPAFGDCASDYSDVCISTFYAAAMTSKLLWAGSYDQHRFAASYYTHGLSTKEWELPDRPGRDYLESKGDLWPLSTDRLGCIHPSDVANVSYREASDDGWNIDTAFTFAALSNGRYSLLTADAGARRWLDGNRGEYSKQFDLNRLAVEQNCRRAATRCVDKLFVFALTSGNHTSGSDSAGGHGLTVKCGRKVKHVRLGSRPGDDYLQNKADLWVIQGESLSHRNRCMKYGDISAVAFTARNSDNWQVQSAFVVAQLDTGKFSLLTADVNVHEFIDLKQEEGDKKLGLTIQKC